MNWEFETYSKNNLPNPGGEYHWTVAASFAGMKRMGRPIQSESDIHCFILEGYSFYLEVVDGKPHLVTFWNMLEYVGIYWAME